MTFFLLGAGVFLISAAFRVAAAFRLTIPLVYALIAPTLFHQWFSTHQALGEGIGYVLFALTALSWVAPLARKIYEMIDQRRADKAAIERFRYRVRKARENGDSVVTVSTEGLYR